MAGSECTRSSAVKYILDEGFSLNHRQWLLANSKLTTEELTEVAMCNKYPSLSINAFSLIGDEKLKVATLTTMFSSGNTENMAVIIHSAINGIKSKKLLWDLHSNPSIPKYAKQFIEEKIYETGENSPISGLIRLGKSKD
jgi:hypothetical protein